MTLDANNGAGVLLGRNPKPEELAKSDLTGGRGRPVYLVWATRLGRFDLGDSFDVMMHPGEKPMRDRQFQRDGLRSRRLVLVVLAVRQIPRVGSALQRREPGRNGKYDASSLRCVRG